jgi:cysteinyl-tRNA synthetase
MRKNLPIIIAVCVLVIFIAVAALFFGREENSRVFESKTTASNSLETTKPNTQSTSTGEASSSTPEPTAEESDEIKASPEESMTEDIFVLDENDPDYREAMRQWVIRIGKIAREQNSRFLIVPQNCAPLFTHNGYADGELALHFISAIDGIGVEGISFGSDNYNETSNESEKAAFLDLLNLGMQNGINVLAIDYCNKEEKKQEALALNEEYGYISYIAEEIELTSIADDYIHTNGDGVLTLDDAKNWLCLLNPEKYLSKSSLIKALSETDYDVLVIDAFFNSDEMLTKEDVEKLKKKSNGAARIVIAYLSIGEAEDYRYYWKDEYYDDPPSWIVGENSRWEGNYPVEYWNEEWQNIIAADDDSYLKLIINAGFDGVYLDIVDGYQTFEDMEEQAR